MRFISHRLHGFAARDQSEAALDAALRVGVKAFEIDVRACADGALVTRHDRFVRTSAGAARAIDTLTRDQARGFDPGIQDLSPLLARAAASESALELFIDVRTFRFVEALVDAVRVHNLLERTIFVSWRPEILVAVAAAAPGSRLAFSHFAIDGALWGVLRRTALWVVAEGMFRRLAKLVGGATAAAAEMLDLRGSTDQRLYADDERDVMVLAQGGVEDAFVSLLARNKGMVVLPLAATSTAIVAAYHRTGVGVCVFSANNEAHVRRARRLGADYAFSDSAALVVRYS